MFPHGSGNSNSDTHYLAWVGSNAGFSMSIGASGSDSLSVWGINGSTGVFAVYGIKFGGGSGGDSLDIYSSEERVVGEWIDGRPSYQITIGDDTTPLSSETDLSSLNLGIDYVISVDGIFADSLTGLANATYFTSSSSALTITYGYVSYTRSTGVLHVYNPGQEGVYCVTIKYVKTSSNQG
jgi:hypothetical protein